MFARKGLHHYITIDKGFRSFTTGYLRLHRAYGHTALILPSMTAVLRVGPMAAEVPTGLHSCYENIEAARSL